MTYQAVMVVFSLIFWFCARSAGMWLINSWISNPFYTHGFVIVSLCFFVWIWNSLKIKGMIIDIKRGILPISFGIICAVIGYYIQFRYVTALSYILLCLGITQSLLETTYRRYVMVPFALLLLVIPLPYLYEISGMASFFTAKAAVFILKYLFPQIQADGIAVYLPPEIEFTIGFNCSGMPSFIGLITVIVLWISIIKNTGMVIAGMFFAVIPIALITNIARICGIVAIARYAGMNRALGIWHTWSAYIFYLISLTIMSLVWYILHKRFNSIFKLRKILI